MGKTYRHTPESMHRKPKGHKQAIINGARKKAIPPDSWEDLNHDDEVFMPFQAAVRMIDKGEDKDTIIKRIRQKYKLSQRQAERIVANATP